MKLFSVNVSEPRTVEYLGRRFSTGIYKEPTEGRHRVGKVNVEGDGQGDLTVHGGAYKAVYVYDDAALDSWRKELGWEDLGPGFFGENLTVRGMPETAVRIGDVYRVGSALLQVTQPRLPCFKLEMKIGIPGFSRRFLSSGRSGFYCRVLEEGEVGPGDGIELESVDPRGVSVSDFIRLYFFDTRDTEGIGRLLRVPSLPPGWKADFEDLLASGGKKGRRRDTRDRAWSGFREFVVDEKIPEGDSLASFTLRPVDGQRLPAFRPGEHLTIRVAVPGRSRPVVRTYSLSQAHRKGRPYRVTVKRESEGDGGFSASCFLHDQVEPGYRLRVAAPRGEFLFDPTDEGPVALISAGVGYAPMIAMLESVAAARSSRPVWYIHGARNGASHGGGGRAQRIAAELPNVTVINSFSRPAPEDVPGVDYHRAGRVDIALVRDRVPRDPTLFYLCGPPGFMNGMLRGLWDWGVPEERIRYELFGSADLLRDRDRHFDTPRGSGASEDERDWLITFSESGISARWDPGYANLLEFAEDNGVFPDFDCRSGICRSCRYEVPAGEVGYAVEPLDPPYPGHAQLCCARPRSDLTIDA